MKRLLVTWLALVLLSGCAAGASSTSAPPPPKQVTITLADGTTHEVAWPTKHEDDKHAAADPDAARAAVKAQGYEIEGEPKRKPKHFEIVGVKDGVRHAIHVELDGKVRHAMFRHAKVPHAKPVAA